MKLNRDEILRLQDAINYRVMACNRMINDLEVPENIIYYKNEVKEFSKLTKKLIDEDVKIILNEQ